MENTAINFFNQKHKQKNVAIRMNYKKKIKNQAACIFKIKKTTKNTVSLSWPYGRRHTHNSASMLFFITFFGFQWLSN